MQVTIIKNSLEFKSIILSFDNFIDIPNKTLNQHLQNPTTPTKFAKNNNVILNKKDIPII